MSQKKIEITEKNGGKKRKKQKKKKRAPHPHSGHYGTFISPCFVSLTLNQKLLESEFFFLGQFFLGRFC